MIRYLSAALALLVLPLWAEASCTHASAGPNVVITCTTGTESTLTQSSTEGLGLGSAFFGKATTGLAVHVETAGTMTAGGVLRAWLQNPLTGQWNRAPDLDVPVQALARQGFLGLSVVSAKGRIAFLPDGVGLAAVIYIIPSY
jgi:hypothetical protein